MKSRCLFLLMFVVGTIRLLVMGDPFTYTQWRLNSQIQGQREDSPLRSSYNSTS
jgi:hypothetical protein